MDHGATSPSGAPWCIARSSNPRASRAAGVSSSTITSLASRNRTYASSTNHRQLVVSALTTSRSNVVAAAQAPWIEKYKTRYQEQRAAIDKQLVLARQVLKDAGL